MININNKEESKYAAKWSDVERIKERERYEYNFINYNNDTNSQSLGLKEVFFILYKKVIIDFWDFYVKYKLICVCSKL